MPNLNYNKPQRERNTNRQATDMRRLRANAYNNPEWRKLRDIYMKEHPLCEECLSQGKITPAQDIHHKESPFKNGETNHMLLLDYNNLQALCKECHGNKHSKQQGKQTVQDVLRILADLLDVEDEEVDNDNQ